jgi:C-terminal processing protease CtpA/Prc
MKQSILCSRHLPALSLALLAVGALAPSSASQADRAIENVRAFAKLYGYVRFFHPADEASAIDWEKFAVYGAERVKIARSSDELRTTLEELLLPIAPAAQIYPTGEPPEPVSLVPVDTSGLKLVAWQHLGVDMGSPGSIYRSKRLNRTLEVAAGGRGFGTVTNGVGAEAYQGKRVKLRAWVRTEVMGTGNQGRLWLRVDLPGGRMGFLDNMSDRPITSSEWAAYEIEAAVADDAVAIAFGCFLLGEGRVWADDFELLVLDEDGGWQPIEISNPGFEEGEKDGKPREWLTPTPGYSYRVTSESPHSGDLAVLIQNETLVLSGPLFDAHPEVHEVIEKEIGAGLSCRVPLALNSDSVRTLSPASEYPLAPLLAALDAIDLETLTADDEAVRLGDVVIAWNVFQHFYPYFDVVDVDWDAELMSSLQAALSDENGEDFFYTLSRLVANVRDGHGNVFHPDYSQRGRLPFLVDWIEGRVLVTFSRDAAVRRGDIIGQIDGIDAEQALRDSERYVSGSRQWRRYRALQAFGAGEAGTRADLLIERGGEILEVQIERRELQEPLSEPRRDNIELLQEGIYYVNLSRAEMSEISERIEELAAARGVVFDLRGYPRGNHGVISHLLESADTSAAWMQVPQVVYPDHDRPAGFDNRGWGLPVLEPHIGGKVVFLSDGRAISYAESFMSFIEHYKLAEIVGQPTAGTNGNVNPFTLPGGFRITWTGMKVVKHDGSQHHLIGILPTVLAERTIQGVIEGRDEFLERALEILNQGS